MLINGSKLTECPVMSLHIGGEIARVVEPIINPDSLKIIGFIVEGKMIRDEVGDVLPIESVREFSRMGLIIDSIDEFVDRNDILKIRKVLELDFSLVGHKVVTRKKVKIGKVSDYTIEVGGWSIQQLIVQRPIMKALFDPELVIPRAKIIEVDDEQVVIKDEHDRAKTKVEAVSPTTFVPNFVNPFREPDFANEKKIES